MKISTNLINKKSLFIHFRDISFLRKKFSYHFYIGIKGIFGFFSE